MEEKKESQGYMNGCLRIFFLLFIIGLLVQYCDNASCDICGDYTYKEFDNTSAFSDEEIADIVGADKVQEFKNKLSSEPSLIYVIKINTPEKLDDGEIRAEIMISAASHIGDVIYKGKLITIKDEETADGMIRIEHRYSERFSKFEQITHSNTQNILFFDLEEDGIRIRNGNSSEFGLSTLNNALFVKD